MEDTGSVVELMHETLRTSESDMLISVSKTSNRNVIVYYVRRDAATGEIDRDNPVRAEWIMFQKDPTGNTREPMSFVEQRAFGIIPRPFRGAPCFSIPALYGGSAIIYVHEEEGGGGEARCLVSFTHADTRITKMCVESVHVNVATMQMDWKGVYMHTGDPVVVRVTNLGMYSHIVG
jgi:Domain of unknown function (DUF4833)